MEEGRGGGREGEMVWQAAAGHKEGSAGPCENKAFPLDAIGRADS